MLKIAIVEDEENYISEIKAYLKQYEEESGEKFSVSVYSDGDGIVSRYKGQFDIILMDIQMKFIDGMTAAEEIRSVDSEVVIIFITNMTQYAVRGYEVDALDYILKPVTYFTFSQKLQKAVDKVKKREKYYLSVPVKGGMYKLSLSSLLYIESQGHILNYHMQDQVVSNREKMSNVEEKLVKHGFFRINKGCIVNLKYVDTVIEGNCILNGETLPVARMKRKLFLEKLTEYISEAVK